jgi:hypothetical protein
MNASVLKWVAGVASSLVVLALIALLNTWADVREMKKAMESTVKAERIAALEADVRNLKEDVAEAEESRSAMWRVIGNKADKRER